LILFLKKRWWIKLFIIKKILRLIEKYAPTQEWFLDNIINLIENASEHINDDILNDVIKLLKELADGD
jgi:hypothetical protein